MPTKVYKAMPVLRAREAEPLSLELRRHFTLRIAASPSHNSNIPDSRAQIQARSKFPKGLWPSTCKV